jgi:hypothetical protein
VRHYYLVAPAMCLCLVIGVGVALCLERVGVARWAATARPRAHALTAGGLSLLVAGIVFQPWRDLVAARRTTSSTTLAENWVHANIPSGTKVYHCGRFIDGPRLVATRSKQQREWGDYFEYGRTNYRFLRQAFDLAYADYRAQKRPVYDLEVTTRDLRKKPPHWLSRFLDRHAIEHGQEYIILAGFHGVENVLDLHFDWFSRVELLQQFGQIAIFRVPKPAAKQGEALVNAEGAEVPPSHTGEGAGEGSDTVSGEEASPSLEP